MSRAMPPLGQRVAAEIADGVIMEDCASTTEVRAFRAAVEGAARKADRDPRAIRIITRLNICSAADGRLARDAVRPTLAGTVNEVVEHAIALLETGVDGVIARPFAAEGGTIEQTIATLGSEVWPRVLGLTSVGLSPPGCPWYPASLAGGTTGRRPIR